MTDGEWHRGMLQAAPTQPLDKHRCVPGARLVETVRHYDFYGAGADSAGNSLRQRLLISTDFQGRQKRFTGQTDWHIEWRACFEPVGPVCRLSGVASAVHVTYTLPRWVDRDAAPEAVRYRWDRYLSSLTAHEKGHGAIAFEVARLIEQALAGRASVEGCDALNTESAQIVEEVMARGEAMQRDYDRTTMHGSAQGANFPF